MFSIMPVSHSVDKRANHVTITLVASNLTVKDPPFPCSLPPPTSDIRPPALAPHALTPPPQPRQETLEPHIHTPA